MLKKRNNTKELIGRLLESKFFVIGGLIVLFLTILAIIAPYVVVYDPNKTNLIEKFIKPEWFSKGWSGHVLGTNALGQDLLTRLLIGARLSFIIAAISTAVAAVFGVALGIISAYYGGFLDNIIMRVCDVQLSIPVMVLAVAVVAMLEPSVPNLIIVLIVTSWVQYARVVRSNVIITKKMEFIMGSRALGASDAWIMFRQILPNVLTPLLILASQQFGYMIIMETALSFVGLGVPPPTSSWGVMITEGRPYISTAPWAVLVPGIALMVAVLGFNFMGDGLRDALDPKMRK